MSAKQRENCIFADRVKDRTGQLQCQACREYYCELEAVDCVFFKSSDEWEFDTTWSDTVFVRKKVKNGN